MRKRNSHIDSLIVNYINSKLTSSRKIRELERWISASDGNLQYFLQRLEDYVSDSGVNRKSDFDKERAYREFRSRVKSSGGELKRTPFRLPAVWRYAAAIVLLCAASYFSYRKGAGNVECGFSDIVVEAPRGSKARLYLPDSTLVWLNAGSSLSYSQGYGIRDRQVRLKGEGYFEVTHNEGMPFLVRSDDLEVRVLGTKFDFRDYGEDEKAAVTLIQGSVTLRNLLRGDEKSVLKPAEQAVLDKGSGTIKVKACPEATACACSWMNNCLFFNEERLEDIVKELQRSYNVNICLSNDSLGKIRFYGLFIRQEQGIDEVLGDLAMTGKVRYEETKGGFILY
ncbi:MAG: DUF4974 domain-containing protein [Bacteroidales bacterium]|nr:DUF4974 domain-containing protein [Bacteroidales bacterium]MCI2146305.1 DUF4974 domain-containing protein [Bacteroidales bacterium]